MSLNSNTHQLVERDSGADPFPDPMAAPASPSTPLAPGEPVPRSDTDAPWHRHVRQAAIELREARKTASLAQLPTGMLGKVFEAELTILDALDTGRKSTQ